MVVLQDEGRRFPVDPVSDARLRAMARQLAAAYLDRTRDPDRYEDLADRFERRPPLLRDFQQSSVFQETFDAATKLDATASG
jgi:hypothetical protein